MSDERFQAAFVLKHFSLLVALVVQLDADARVEKRQFAQTFRERVVVEGDVSENQRAGLEAQCRALLIGIANGGERSLRLPPPRLLAMPLAVPAGAQFPRIRERIGTRDSHALQSAGDFLRT